MDRRKKAMPDKLRQVCMNYEGPAMFAIDANITAIRMAMYRINKELLTDYSVEYIDTVESPTLAGRVLTCIRIHRGEATTIQSTSIKDQMDALKTKMQKIEQYALVSFKEIIAAESMYTKGRNIDEIAEQAVGDGEAFFNALERLEKFEIEKLKQ